MGNLHTATEKCQDNDGTKMKKTSGERKAKRQSSETRVARTASTYVVPIEVTTKLTVKMKLTDEQIQEVKEAFAMYDKGCNGTILTKSFIYVMRSLGQNPTEDEYNDMMCHNDLHEAGFIDFVRFLQMWAKYSADVDETIKDAFNLFDNDGSGAISMDEFRKVMSKEGAQMTDEEIDEIIKEVDVNGDGQMNIDEFVTMLQS